MSYSWITDSWGGPANDLDYFPAAVTYTGAPSTAFVASNFPQRPLVNQSIPQGHVNNYDYQVPTYLLLKDMSADKTPLVFQRGGYMGLPPTAEGIAKCATASLSGNFYCGASQSKPSVQLLGTYGP
jgi:hypothetical protein